MGLRDAFRKKPRPTKESGLRTGFILAGNNALPAPNAIVDAAGELGLDGLNSEPTGKDDILSFRHPLGNFMVTFIGARHPDAAEMPSGPFSPTSEEIESTSSHFITVLTDGNGSLKERDLAMAQFTGAVALANQSLAAMLGHGVTFHKTATFVMAIVEAGDDGIPVPGGVDITLAREPDGRASLLTHGMERYGREDLYVVAPATEASMKDAYDFAGAMASWMLSVDTEFNDGETVGRSAEERIKILRAKSPVDRKRKVIRLEL